MKCLNFATGNLYRQIGKINILEFISNLDVDGVEYTFGKTYSERPITDSDLNYLKSYDFVSFHWPFRLSLKCFSEKEIFRQAELIAKAYLKSKGKQMVIHPGLPVPKYVFSKSKINFLSENMESTKYNPNRPRLGFEYHLRKNPDFGLCLDVNHAYSWSVNETERIVAKWKKRIKQVHFSNNYRGKSHLGFEKVSKDFLKSIEPLRELDVPIVIEEDMRTGSLMKVKAEVKRVRNILDF